MVQLDVVTTVDGRRLFNNNNYNDNSLWEIICSTLVAWHQLSPNNPEKKLQ